MSVVFRRTVKGDEEIQKRTYKLDHFHRFILIMINGKADVDSIVSRSSEKWDPDYCLQDLEQNGFIENIDSKTVAISTVGGLQQDLINCIKQHLPDNNTKIINIILNSEKTLLELSNAVDSVCILANLTIPETISKQLNTELLAILDSDSYPY